MRGVGGERGFDQSSEQMRGGFESTCGATLALNATAGHRENFSEPAAALQKPLTVSGVGRRRPEL